MSTAAMVQYAEPIEALTQWRPPAQVLAEAQQAAKALTEVISLKKKPVMFNGEQYLEFEDWQTCAKFYGVTAKVLSTGYVNYDGVRGFEATAVALDREGREISRAEALCLNDEENWGMIPKYEWQDDVGPDGKKIWDDGRKRYKSKKVLVGEVAKPLFQLKSMAQTRACSKVLRQVFSWVVVLAGYRPTPAEEMTGHEHDREDERDERAPVTQPRRASENSAPELVAISGVIESAKMGKEGSVWFTLDKKIVAVRADLARETMAVGGKLSVKTVKRSSEKAEYYWTVEVLESIAPQAGSGGGGGAPQEASSERQDEFVQELDSAMSEPSAESAIRLDEMFDQGNVKKASDLSGGNGGGKVIGKSRAQRLYTIITQHKKETGFSDVLLKRIIAEPPLSLEHLTDLPMDWYERIERLCDGKDDWRKYLEGE